MAWFCAPQLMCDVDRGIVIAEGLGAVELAGQRAVAALRVGDTAIACCRRE